jgi:hypothetical protein
MMADLEHVDIAEHALVDQRLQHVTFGVPGQHRREPLGIGQQHDARLVGGRVLDCRRGRDDGERDPSGRDRIARGHFADAVGTAQALGS